MYFIANWKMFGDLRTLNSLDSVIKFSNSSKKNKFKIIYCPPNTLIRPLSKRLKKTNINIVFGKPIFTKKEDTRRLDELTKKTMDAISNMLPKEYR